MAKKPQETNEKDNEETGAAVAGPALSPQQAAGLEPVDRLFDNEQAEHRDELTNRQTDHEAENALDGLSSTPNVAVAPGAPLTAVATGAPVSDMSGRPALQPTDEAALQTMRTALTEARRSDRASGVEKDRVGWRTPLDMGIPGGVAARLQSVYPERIEVEELGNAAYFPETGKRYRLA